MLDEEMLQAHGVPVASALTPDVALPVSSTLAEDLGGRLLVKYVRTADARRFSPALGGPTFHGGVHYVTPTALCREELLPVLALPPLATPNFALLLDPGQVAAAGPRRIRSGQGLEYVLLHGFPASAIVGTGWPVQL